MRLVAAVLLENDNNELLFGRRTEDKLYSCPGGKHEEGEAVVWTAIRELFEETNISAMQEDMHFLGYVEPEGKIVMFFWCPIWKGRLRNAEPKKCLGWEWHPWDKWPKEGVPGMQLFGSKLLGALMSMRHFYGKIDQ